MYHVFKNKKRLNLLNVSTRELSELGSPTEQADNNPQQDLLTPTGLSGRKSVSVSAKLSLRCPGFVPGCGLVIGEEDQTFQRRRLPFIGLDTKGAMVRGVCVYQRLSWAGIKCSGTMPCQEDDDLPRAPRLEGSVRWH